MFCNCSTNIYTVFLILFLQSISYLQVNAHRKCFLLLERFCSTLFLGYSECSVTNGELLNQSRVRNGKVQEKRRQLCAPTRKKTQKRAAAARPPLQSERKAELSRFPATLDNVSLPSPPQHPHSRTIQKSRTKKWSPPAFQDHEASRADSLPLHNWGLGPCFCNQSSTEGGRRVPQGPTLPGR